MHDWVDEIHLSSSTGNDLLDLNATKSKTRDGHRHYWALFGRAVSVNGKVEYTYRAVDEHKIKLLFAHILYVFAVNAALSSCE